MEIFKADFAKSFIKTADDGARMGWHERNGGNMSYRCKQEEIAPFVKSFTTTDWREIGGGVPDLAGEYFLVTGSTKFFSNIAANPYENIGVIEIDGSGKKYRICAGLDGGKARPTSEIPTHLMNHAVKKRLTGGVHRIIYHAHPANIIALTFVLPLENDAFTRELWEMMPECSVVFPKGVGVAQWGVPGSLEIALETSALMEKYDAVVWAHHGLFCSGETFDDTFGLMHTVEKAAEILVKVMAMGGKRQTTTPRNFRDLSAAFKLDLPERFMN